MTEPLTAERLAAIEADLDAAWTELGETNPIVARAVNGSYVLLSRYQRQSAEVTRLTALITAPDGGGIPLPLLDELQSIAAESGCGHRAAIAVAAETGYSVGSEHAEDLRAERDRFREHSTTLNTVAWKLAQSLGDIPAGADRVDGDPVELAERLIAELTQARAELAKPVRVVVVLDAVRGRIHSITASNNEARQHVRELVAKHNGPNHAATMTVGLVDRPAAVPAAPATVAPTVQAEPADQLCSDKNGFHDGHEYRPAPGSGIVWCPGYPVPVKAAPVVAEAPVEHFVDEHDQAVMAVVAEATQAEPELAECQQTGTCCSGCIADFGECCKHPAAPDGVPAAADGPVA